MKEREKDMVSVRIYECRESEGDEQWRENDTDKDRGGKINVEIKRQGRR